MSFIIWFKTYFERGFSYYFVGLFLIFLSPSMCYSPCSLWLLPPSHAFLTSIPFRHLSSPVISDLLFYSDDGDLTDVSAEPMGGLTQLLTMAVSNIFWFVVLCHVVIAYFKPSLQRRLAGFTFCLQEHTELWFLFLYPLTLANLLSPSPIPCPKLHKLIWSNWIPTFPPGPGLPNFIPACRLETQELHSFSSAHSFAFLFVWEPKGSLPWF